MTSRAEKSMSGLLQHHSWANRAIFVACENVKDDQGIIDFGIGYGSVNKTLLHIAGAMMRWCDRIEKRTLRPTPENSNHEWTLPEIRAVFHDANNDFDEIAEKCFDNRMDDVVIDIEGAAVSLPVEIVVSYLIIHGAHHRAQLLHMLKRLGIPLPEIDVIDFELWKRLL